jgi:hypothetical protein
MPSLLSFAIASSVSGLVLLVCVYLHHRSRRGKSAERMAEAQKGKDLEGRNFDWPSVCNRMND